MTNNLFTSNYNRYYYRENDGIKDDLKTANSRIDCLKGELQDLQQRFDRAVQKNVEKQLQQDKDKSQEENVMSLPNTRNTSPTLSLGKLSMSESLNSSFWPGVS